jgi:membrane protease YdiL (CAAX protease family)
MVGLGLTVNVGASLLHGAAKIGYWVVAEEFVAYAILFAALKVLFGFHRRPLLRSLGWIPSPFSPWSLLGWGFAVFLVSVILQVLLRTPEMQTPFDKLIDSDMLSRVVIAIFGVSAGPAIEELLFRGLLQPVLINAAGVLPGILITSVLFGAVHLNQNAFLWQSGVLIALAGFVFGTVRHVTGSTCASTLTHIAYNAVPCLVTLLQGMQPTHR